MSAPMTEDAALRIGRFSLVVWLLGLLVLCGALGFAVPRLLPHLFTAAAASGADPGPAAEPAAGNAPDPAPGAGEATGTASTAAGEGTVAEAGGPGSYAGSGNAVLGYQRPAGYDGPFEIVIDSDVDASVAVDDPENPDWPVHFLYNSGDRNEPSAGLLATAREEFSLHVEADGDWRLEVRPVAYAVPEDGTVAGSGPALVRYEGDEVLAEFTYTGDANIAVYTWQESRRNLVVNKIGSSTTRFSWQPYPVTYFLVYTSEGSWSLDVGR